MGDGTVLLPGVGGDTIADEDLSGKPRLSPQVPQVGGTGDPYKLPRTKIAIGDFGQDRGDVNTEAPFPVEDGRARRLNEMAQLRASDQASISARGRSSERMPTQFSARTGRDGRT